MHLFSNLRWLIPAAFTLFIIAVAFLSQSCSREFEATYVDFSKRAAVEQPGKSAAEEAYFRVAVGAMISARETVGSYHQLLNYIAHKLGREVQLVQRKTYSEIDELISQGQIDMAFICSGPYASGKVRYGFQALAMPVVRGSPFYQAYLIVNKNSKMKELADLRSKVFAFSDPESNTGRLVPLYWLKQQNEKPEDFFGKTVYTYSHDNSIMAVAMSLVDGAAVNGQIWEYYNRTNPIYTSKTRIIKKSRPFGTPPVVVSASLPSQMKIRIGKLLLSMHRDPAGRKILEALMIDRFIAPKDQYYEPILAMLKSM